MGLYTLGKHFSQGILHILGSSVIWIACCNSRILSPIPDPLIHPMVNVSQKYLFWQLGF
jgi:hypothetical protein